MNERLYLPAILAVLIVVIVGVFSIVFDSYQLHVQCYSEGTLIFDKIVEVEAFGYSLDGQRIYLPDNCIRTRIK